MRVLVAGVKRSGSTWVWNVCRVALIQSGRNVRLMNEPSEIRTSLRGRPDGDVLAKWHWWDEPFSRLFTDVVSTWRNVEEVYESLTRFNDGIPPTGAYMAKVVEHGLRWDRAANIQIKYEDIVANPVGVVERVVAGLRLDASPESVWAQVDRIKPPAQGQDPETLLFHNHRA